MTHKFGKFYRVTSLFAYLEKCSLTLNRVWMGGRKDGWGGGVLRPDSRSFFTRILFPAPSCMKFSGRGNFSTFMSSVL